MMIKAADIVRCWSNLQDAETDIAGLMDADMRGEFVGIESDDIDDAYVAMSAAAVRLMHTIDLFRAAVAAERNRSGDVNAEHRLSMQQLGVSPRP